MSYESRAKKRRYKRVERLRRRAPESAERCCASTLEIEARLGRVDMVIGAVLIHGASAPFVIRRKQLGLMSRPTTNSDPTFEVDGITHHCVANMPGAVPATSTYVLTNATLPFVLHLAGAGVAGGKVRDEPFAEATGQPHTGLFEALGERGAA